MLSRMNNKAKPTKKVAINFQASGGVTGKTMNHGAINANALTAIIMQPMIVVHRFLAMFST